MAVERKFIKENVKRLLVRDYVRKEVERSGFGGLDIQRTPLGTQVTIIAERPGMVIGRKGSNVNKLTGDLYKRFGLENPRLKVQEVRDSSLNAQIMAIRVAESLERGWHFRRVGHQTVQRIMESGAQGVIVEIAGKLTGAKRRREKFIAGHIKYCGETAYELMESGHAQCKKKLGVIGCTVRIMRADAVLPDHIEIRNETVAEAVAKVSAAAEPAKEKEAESKLPENFEDLRKADLEELAQKLGVDLTGKATKADMQEAIRAGVLGQNEPKRERRSFQA